MIPDDPAPWLLYACPCGCGLLVTADEYRVIRRMVRSLIGARVFGNLSPRERQTAATARRTAPVHVPVVPVSVRRLPPGMGRLHAGVPSRLDCPPPRDADRAPRPRPTVATSPFGTPPPPGLTPPPPSRSPGGVGDNPGGVSGVA